MRINSVSQTQVMAQQTYPYLKPSVQLQNESLSGAWELAKKIGNGTTNIIRSSFRDAVNCIRKNSDTLKGYASKLIENVNINITVGGIASSILGASKKVGHRLCGAAIDCFAIVYNLGRDIKKGDPKLTQAMHSMLIAAPSCVTGGVVAGAITALTGGAGLPIAIVAGLCTSSVVADWLRPRVDKVYPADEQTKKLEKFF